ncbi:MAG TPA: DUF6265 family protein [Candidatus Acidoferrales bacterium]|nr:DUF6265 family protein [Candidatus Acidoferrales bacterium]
MTRRTLLAISSMAIVAAGLLFGQGANCEVKSASVGKFKIEQELILAATPNEVFDAATGDISPWWDHSFSGHPKKLFIEAKPGGGFWEIFNDAGEGVKHATVIYAERGKMLRFEGPLGFSGTAMTMVTTYTLNADPAGTKFHLTVAATGDVDESTAKIVDQVWHHFLDERLKPYIASGDYKKHAASAGGDDGRRPPTPQGNGASARFSPFTITEVAWLSGRWTGTAGSAVTDEMCTAPSHGEMSCMFRAVDAGKIEGLEFITLREIPAPAGGREGIEERVRFFGPDLSAKEGDNGITLRMASVSPTEIIFDNAKTDGFVKHMTISRQSEDEFSTHIEVVDATGKTGSIDAKWKREK